MRRKCTFKWELALDNIAYSIYRHIYEDRFKVVFIDGGEIYCDTWDECFTEIKDYMDAKKSWFDEAIHKEMKRRWRI